MGPRLRELDTNFTKRLRKQRSGGTLVVAAKRGAVLPFRNSARMGAEDLVRSPEHIIKEMSRAWWQCL